MEHDRKDDPRRVFVEGAKWWQHYHNGATAFASQVTEMEREANKRFTLPEAPESDPKGAASVSPTAKFAAPE